MLFSPEQRLRWRRDLRAQHGLSQDEVVYLYVGDLRKGAARCIQALGQLREGKLVLVSRSSIDPYRRIAESARTADRVLFLGPSEEIQTVYALADALLLPTPYDAFAMVVSEAMASGLPVVVSRMAGASELVQHGVNGLLLDDVTNVDELAQCMHALAADRAWAAELGRQARKAVEAMTWDSVAEQTMQVYEEVLRRAR